MDWGDIGTLAIDPNTSKVQDKVGAVILPGSKKVLDRATGEFVPCNSTRCPRAIIGINHAPFAAFGGWSGGINSAAKAKVKDAAYEFFSYMSQPAQANVDVTIGITGFNPYRISQFENLDLWIKAGMSRQAAEDYLGAIKASLNSPNMVLDLRIPLSRFLYDYPAAIKTGTGRHVSPGFDPVLERIFDCPISVHGQGANAAAFNCRHECHPRSPVVVHVGGDHYYDYTGRRYYGSIATFYNTRFADWSRQRVDGITFRNLGI